MTVSTSTNADRTVSGRHAPGPAAGATGWALIAEVDAAVRSVLASRGWNRQTDRQGAGAEVFAERLFALRHAEALPAANREVRVAPGTIVTPLARELLKKRGVALRWVAKGMADRVKHPGEWGFAIEAGAESGVIAALRRVLLEEGWTEVDGSLDDATCWVLEAPYRGTLVVTDEASLAVWRACQVPGVRAGCVADP